MTECPPKLYKYVGSIDAVANLVAGKVKFTPVADLNDPFELNSFVDADAIARSLQTLRNEGCQQIHIDGLGNQQRLLRRLAPEYNHWPDGFVESVTPELLNLAYRMPAYDLTDALIAFFENVARKIRAEVGVLSLAANLDIVPMWGNYADKGKGFVVEFTGLDQVFDETDTGVLNCVKPVRYVDPFEGMTFDPRTTDRLFYDKKRPWAYECEWRVIRPLSDCYRAPSEGSLLLADIPPEHVTGIICGYNTPPEAVRTAQALGRAGNCAVGKAVLERASLRVEDLK